MLCVTSIYFECRQQSIDNNLVWINWFALVIASIGSDDFPRYDTATRVADGNLSRSALFSRSTHTRLVLLQLQNRPDTLTLLDSTASSKRLALAAAYFIRFTASIENNSVCFGIWFETPLFCVSPWMWTVSFLFLFFAELKIVLLHPVLWAWECCTRSGFLCVLFTL